MCLHGKIFSRYSCYDATLVQILSQHVAHGHVGQKKKLNNFLVNVVKYKPWKLLNSTMKKITSWHRL